MELTQVVVCIQRLTTAWLSVCLASTQSTLTLISHSNSHFTPNTHTSCTLLVLLDVSQSFARKSFSRCSQSRGKKEREKDCLPSSHSVLPDTYIQLLLSFQFSSCRSLKFSSSSHPLSSLLPPWEWGDQRMKSESRGKQRNKEREEEEEGWKENRIEWGKRAK